MKSRFTSILFVLSAVMIATVNAQITTPVPSPQQMAWHNMEFYLFAHFGPNTFTGEEWGHGNEKAEVFNPAELDCRQWVRIAKLCGAKGIIITAKHHDGFCLWPSKYSTHTVRESSWRNGRGDVLKELSDACKEGGIKFGVYLSPWDRNHPTYGTGAYNQVYVNMLKEIFDHYGPITELWWDGANGEGPNGKKQQYDWTLFKKTVRELSPNTVVFSDVGPGIRWVGNEKGIAGTTNWNLLNTDGFQPGAGAPPTDTLTTGNIYGNYWIPAECDVSIRPGWFYHAKEDNKVKSPEALFDLYLKSVGRGANLLLNVPPDTKGLIHENDSASLVAFHDLITKNFSKDLAEGSVQQSTKNAVFMQLEKDTSLNCVMLGEDISKGQRVIAGQVQLIRNKKVIKQIPFTTIGRKRILSFDTVVADAVNVEIQASKAAPLLNNMELYLIDDSLVETN